MTTCTVLRWMTAIVGRKDLGLRRVNACATTVTSCTALVISRECDDQTGLHVHV